MTVYIDRTGEPDDVFEREVLARVGDPVTAPQPATPGSDSVREEPLLVSGMRRRPTGEVRHIPGGQIGMSGTSTRGFLAELDRYLAAVRAEAKAEALEEAAHTLDDNGDQMIEIALGGAPYVHYFLCDRAAAYRTNPSSEETDRGL